MPTVRFLGRVLPYGAIVGATNVPKVRWQRINVDLDMTFSIHIANSFIYMECDVNRFETPLDFSHIYQCALDTARTTTNFAAFLSATSLTATLDTVIEPTGIPTAIINKEPYLADIAAAHGIAAPDEFGAIVSMVLEDWNLMFALDDLVGAISLHHWSPVNCGRVVDAIRGMIGPPENVRRSWKNLRSYLNVSEDYLRNITDAATGPRHGDRRETIAGPELMEILKRTWTITARYLVFKKNGNIPLSEGVFPILY